MPLASGVRFSSYQVVDKIGEGGMGEVYRARDTRLGRDVALKVLPAVFATDRDRLARFQREAQVLASLNHPNIGAIHGLEDSADGPALVLELIEGPTLADRIAGGPIPLDEALSISRQIAEALAAAHDRGIVHRDLKPANIKLRPDGVVKVLDFGLAKAAADDGAGDSTESPTITTIGTKAGVIVGTAAYMSPEQARGRPIDKRTDIWAFGCVFYEMLTGKRAFERETLSDTLAAVLGGGPDWTTIGPEVPASVRLLIQQCLERDRTRRIADISTALFVVNQPGMAAPVESPTGVASSSRQVRVWRLAISATAALLAAGAVGLWLWNREETARSAVRFTFAQSGPSSVAPSGSEIAISPDGTRIVYVGNQGAELFLRDLDRLEPVSLLTGDFPWHPFFSPDGRWVGFVGQFVIKKVAITGGPAEIVSYLGARQPLGATWGENGTIIFATSDAATGLEEIPATGGESKVLTRPNLDQGEVDHAWPVFLPGGKSVLFTITGQGGIDTAQVAVLDIAAGTYKSLLKGGSHARYVPTGHLVYGAAGTLRAIAFNLDRLEVSGAPVPVLPQLLTTALGAASFAISSDGTLAFVPGGLASSTRTMTWVDRQGREEPINTPARTYQYLRLSPDGTRAALDIRDQENDIWFWEFARRRLVRFTFDPTRDRFPVWLPDGRRLLFTSDRAGAPNVFVQASDGTGEAQQLTRSQTDDQVATSVSPTGATAVVRTGAPQRHDLALLSLSPDYQVRPLLNHASYSEQNGEVSPDGRWLAYQSNEGHGGRAEVYVRPFPNVNGGRWQISTGGGSQPLWGHGGKELFYVSASRAMMSVSVDAGPSWTASEPTTLFESGGRFYFGAGEAFGRTYDYDKDGRRFLIIRTTDSASTSRTPPGIVVVQSWFDELGRLVSGRP